MADSKQGAVDPSPEGIDAIDNDHIHKIAMTAYYEDENGHISGAVRAAALAVAHHVAQEVERAYLDQVFSLQRELADRAPKGATEAPPEPAPGAVTFAELQQRAHKTATRKGWHDQHREPGTLFMLIVSELAEAFEEHRNGRAFDEIYHGDNGKPEGIAVELADAVIRIMDTAAAHGIDLAPIIQEKEQYNDGRAYRHGGKKV